MTIETIFETDKYRWDYDSLYGVGWFVRKSDDAVSLMETGSDAEEVKSEFAAIEPAGLFKIAAFNSVASQQSYWPRWSDGEKADMKYQSQIDNGE